MSNITMATHKYLTSSLVSSSISDAIAPSEIKGMPCALSLVPGPLFTKYTGVLPQDLVKSWSCEILVYSFPIALKFDRHLGNSTAEMPVKFQSDITIITLNLAALSFHKIWQ